MTRRTTAPQGADESASPESAAQQGVQRSRRTARASASPGSARAATSTPGARKTAGPPVAKRKRIRPVTSPIPMLGCDVPNDYATMVQYAMTLSRATVGIPEQLQGSPENIIAVMTIARAIQLPMAVVFQNVFSHEKGRGQVGERSRLLHMLARRAGHRLEIEELSDDICAGVIWLHGEKEPKEVEYTILDAEKLGLLEEWRDKNKNWQKQPANMLRNRWVTRCVDWWCPEVKMGADFAADGGLLLDGVNDDEDLVLTGLGPEVTRLLDAIDKAKNLPDAGTRYAKLRGIWTDARMLVDTVIDEEGATLGNVLSAALAEARQDAEAESAQETPVDLSGADKPADKPADKAAADKAPPERGTAEGKAKARRLLEDSRARRDEQAAREQAQQALADAQGASGGLPGRLPCGCALSDVAATGAHAATCADLTRRLLDEGADRR